MRVEEGRSPPLFVCLQWAVGSVARLGGDFAQVSVRPFDDLHVFLVTLLFRDQLNEFVGG